uniref:Reverse transcriptase domain-containing protein n=1 Tax=Tanacetum cinerariifolium TaxID=118510 RepID=A0A6L2LVY0_TANCI|nr:reverse transcriptase domain-containing protein [Tanacetum cinerariifolium]
MSSASSVVTYTFVYTDSESGRVFWGANEELSDGGSPRVIVYGYDGLPMQPVAPPSPDYIPGPEEPQTPPAPQDEDEYKTMFIQPHDPDYVPEPRVRSKRGSREYEDDETKDGPVDYHMDGGDDGDDDVDDSSGDDADDEDEDEEEEEHLAPIDSAIVIPTIELAAISFPLEAEVERLLAMPTPPPSPLTSLSPPSAGEHLARCTALSACPSPPPVPSPLLPSSGCPTQIQTLRMASTQALIDAVTAALPSPPLPPPLYIPPPIDRRDDVPKTEMPPHKRLCLSTLGSRYEVEESSTARPTEGRGIDYGFVSTVDAEARRRRIGDVGYGIRDTWVNLAKAVPEIAPMTLGEVNTRVTELADLHKNDTHDLYALLEDAQDSRTRISQRVTMDSQRVDLLMEDMIAHQETILIVEKEAYVTREAWAHSIGLSQAVHSELQTHREQTQHHVHETHFQIQQAEIAELRETDRRCQAQMIETLRVMGDMRREMGDMQAELLALREQSRRARQSGSDARVPNHQDTPRDTDSVVGLTRWIKKMESVFQISGCAIENHVKFATCILLDAALTWWNSLIRSLGPGAYSMTWEVLKKKMTDKYCPHERQTNKRKADDLSRNNHGHKQQLFNTQNVAKVASHSWSFASAVPGPMTHLVTSLTPDSTSSYVMQGASCTQRKVSMVLFVLTYVLLLVVIVVMVVIVMVISIVVFVAIVGVVVVVVGSSVSSINKLSFVIVACASRPAATPFVISCRMEASVIAGVADESNIGDSDNTGDGGKIAGRAITTWGGGMVSYACMTSIFESSCIGEKTSTSKRYLVKSFEESGEMLPGEAEK